MLLEQAGSSQDTASLESTTEPIVWHTPAQPTATSSLDAVAESSLVEGALSDAQPALSRAEGDLLHRDGVCGEQLFVKIW